MAYYIQYSPSQPIAPTTECVTNYYEPTTPNHSVDHSYLAQLTALRISPTQEKQSFDSPFSIDDEYEGNGGLNSTVNSRRESDKR